MTRDLEYAISLLNRAERDFPSDSGLLANLGNAFAELEKYGHATYYFEKALNIDSTSISALRGRLHVTFGEWQRTGGVRLEFREMVELGERLRRIAPDHEATLAAQANLIHFAGNQEDPPVVSNPHVQVVRAGAKAFAEWRAAHPDQIPNLRRASLRPVSFTGMDLRGADFSDADLRAADFSSADPRGAVLSGAFLDDANLEGVDLSYAEMREVMLRRAILRNAKLSCATIVGMRLAADEAAAADVTAVDLTGVILSDLSDGPTIGGFLELALATRLENAVFGCEVEDYLRCVLAYAKRSDIRDRSLAAAAIRNAEAALATADARGRVEGTDRQRNDRDCGP